MGANQRVESFHWSKIHDRCGVFSPGRDFKLAASGRAFESQGIRITPPLVFPVTNGDSKASAPESAPELATRQLSRRSAQSNSDLEAFLKRLPLEPSLHCLILLQAGAASLGMFQSGEVRYTKSMKRYVVRGNGRAQPAYLKSKGKSRAGSRLRLQNARLLFEEVNAKLGEFFDEFGAPDLIFVGAPVRLWPDLFRAKVQPPFDQEHPIIKVPLDLPVPTTEVLLRTYKSLCYGKIEPFDPLAIKADRAADR